MLTIVDPTAFSGVSLCQCSPGSRSRLRGSQLSPTRRAEAWQRSPWLSEQSRVGSGHPSVRTAALIQLCAATFRAWPASGHGQRRRHRKRRVIWVFSVMTRQELAHGNSRKVPGRTGRSQHRRVKSSPASRFSFWHARPVRPLHDTRAAVGKRVSPFAFSVMFRNFGR